MRDFFSKNMRARIFAHPNKAQIGQRIFRHVRERFFTGNASPPHFLQAPLSNLHHILILSYISFLVSNFYSRLSFCRLHRRRRTERAAVAPAAHACGGGGGSDRGLSLISSCRDY